MRSDLINTGIEYRREQLRLAMVEARQELGLSQRELAGAAKVSPGVISRFESNGPAPGSKNLRAVVEALGIDLEDFGEEYTTPSQQGVGVRTHSRARSATAIRKYLPFGDAMREARIKHGLSQVDVEERMQVSGCTLTVWEGGRKLPRLHNLAKWCAVLGEDFDDWGDRRDEAWFGRP